MINYQLGILIAIFSFVYAELMTEPDMIFNHWYRFLDRVFKTDERKNEGKGYHPAFMILVHCSKCISGQVAFWMFVYCYQNIYLEDVVNSAIHHVLFTFYTIFCTYLISTLNKHIAHE